MKRILALVLAVLMVASSAYAISWTKLWSSADDGSPYSGSDIGTMQNDINSQVPTLTGNNTMTGNNTFSGTTTFSGTITGITGSAAHIITRGFELVWQSTTVVRVNTGTLYHNTTQVNKATVTDLDITAAGDAIDGATTQQATSVWRYVYCDSSGNLKLWSVAPDKSDTAGNTAGTKIYYYYAVTTTYYRCLGAIRLNSTGAGEIEKFYQTGNIISYDYVYGNATTLVLNAGAAAAFTSVSCATIVPPISTLADLQLINTGTSFTRLRVTGSSSTDTVVGCAAAGNPVNFYHVPLNSAQSLDYYIASGAMSIWVIGYTINIR